MTSKAGHTAGVDWYERRSELLPGHIFITHNGEVVQLDRRVPGDGTQWYVADWWNGWSYMDSTIEPGDLAEKFDDVTAAIAKATAGGAP